MACKEACGCAARQGTVLDAPGMVGIHADCTLFLRQQVVFIRVKRGRSLIRSPQELVILFSSEIALLRTVPLTPVVSRQVWVLLPWGTWQYFSIFDDRIVEIHPDTINEAGTEKKIAGIPGQTDTARVLSTTRGSDVS
jgi:hypothetical protein